jgi:hypothetical protein
MTSVKTLVVAAALSVVPAISMAMCGSKSHQAMSCAEGMVWDAQQQACVQQVMS